MPLFATNCDHVDSPSDLTIAEDVIEGKEQFSKCNDCEFSGSNLWLCLFAECHYVGCDEKHLDHSSIHHDKFPQHMVQMNLSSHRIWCYMCQKEVQIEQLPLSQNSLRQMDFKVSCTGSNNKLNDSCENMDYTEINKEKLERILLMKKQQFKRHMEATRMAERKFEEGDIIFDKSDDYNDSSDVDETKDYSGKPRGLVGLQNIGNTCYMNAALQALSNIPHLNHYFLECDQIILNIIAGKRELSKHPLSVSFLKLLKDMWSRESKNSVVPHALLNGIRIVHPMFRGYHQHDTQEFLRCFMDQLHEELKEQMEDNHENFRLKGGGDHSSEDEETEIEGTGSSQSDGEYETCDSGVSEQSSLSDEGDQGIKIRYSKMQIKAQNQEKARNQFNRSCKKPSIDVTFSQSPKSGQNSPIKQKVKKAMKTKSIVSDVFDGKLLSSVKCLSCDRISTRVETFQDLSLPIPSRDHIDMLHQGSITPQKTNPCSEVVYVNNQTSWITWFLQWMRSWLWGPVVSLHDCLSAFFSADELKGDNMYSCEKCNKLRNGTKFSEVLELPEVLCIHLKRFRHELMFSSKIANYVSFPLEGLDMQSFVHKECISKVTTYDLVSVICHHGTAGGGHYICYALNPIINEWFEFDDQRVTRVSAETVKNCEAYVLFYKKFSAEMMQIRNKAVELMEITSKDPLSLRFYVSRQWINRLNTFAEPGPIDNSDFLCPHGGVDPVKARFVDHLSIPLPQNVWEFLYETFGGGLACTQLYECSICEEKYESLQKRRYYELDIYQQLNRHLENPTAMYALSMSWFRQWQSFIKGREVQPPGPIDNSSIIVSKGSQTVLKIGSDYVQVPDEVWQFFENTYGGGPEIMLPSGQRPLSAQSNLSSTFKPVTAKSIDTISSQDSGIDKIVQESSNSNDSNISLKNSDRLHQGI